MVGYRLQLPTGTGKALTVHTDGCCLQEKHQKQVAAAYAWSTKTKHKALTALLSYSQFRLTRAQQTVAARHHCAMTRKAGVLAAWRPCTLSGANPHSAGRHDPQSETLAMGRLTVFGMPLRLGCVGLYECLRVTDYLVLCVCDCSGTTTASDSCLQAGAWCATTQNLLRMAEGRLRRRALAAAFLSWRRIAALKHRRRSLLTVSVEQQQLLYSANCWPNVVPVS